MRNNAVQPSKSTFKLVYTVESGVNNIPPMTLCAGEVESDTPYHAAVNLEPSLLARLGKKNQHRLIEAKIMEGDREAAVLQIDKEQVIGQPGVTKRVPRWGAWLTIHY